MRETQSHTHPPPPGFGISVHAPADPAERPGVRRVKSERRERGGGRSPEKLLEGESSQGQGAHPSSFGKVLALFMIMRGWSGPQLREGTAQGHWWQPSVLKTGNAVCCSPT